MAVRLVLLKSYFIVFVASACGLIIELVAGRMMAPYIGVSLYTWTSVIGVVLAGISLGNYLGGRIADRAPRPQTLGMLFLLSGLSSMMILALVQFVGSKAIDLPVPLMAKIALTIAIVFFLPSLLLGTITPVVVKLSLKDIARTGSTVGKIYAWSTLGSIVGTFATGFFLISWFGTRAIVAGVAVTLILMALAFGELWKRKEITIVAPLFLLVVFAGFAVYLDGKEALKTPPDVVESNYYTIRTFDQPTTNEDTIGRVRVLVLDHLVHSFVSEKDPTHLEYSYEKVYKDITEYMAQTRPSMDVAFIGGGGYTFPRYMEHVYPTSKIDVVEIDPAVTQINFDKLWLPRDTRIVTHNEDGRLYFNNTEPIKGKYDLILGDAFNDLSVPYHLTTLEFDQKLEESMKPDGVFMANIIDNPSRGDFLRPYVNTLKQVFPHVTVAAVGEGWKAFAQNTLIVVASGEPLDGDKLVATLKGLGEDPVTKVMTEADMDAYLSKGTDMVLTDDHAPVDQLIAKLFDERGS